jgi:Methylamine utilisation protein MauE
MLAILLVAAGVTKLLTESRDQVIAAIRNYHVLPDALVAPAAVALPWLEVTLGILLGAGVLLVVTASCVALTFGVFAAAVGWHVLRGRQFACGCGGGGAISLALAARDLVLCVTAVAIASGPSSGLAAWPGWTSSHVSESWRAMIPMPLVTILLVAVTRLLMASRQARPRSSLLAGSRRAVA